jgi:hypothetical protein
VPVVVPIRETDMTQQAVTGRVPERPACFTNPLAGFGSEASESQHPVLNAAHSTKGMTTR